MCADCRFARIVQSDRGSTFYLCQQSLTDPSFPKYPRLPVLTCSGYGRVVIVMKPEQRPGTRMRLWTA